MGERFVGHKEQAIENQPNVLLSCSMIPLVLQIEDTNNWRLVASKIVLQHWEHWGDGREDNSTFGEVEGERTALHTRS